MTAQEIVEQIRPLSLESYKNTLLRHGVQEPVFGVKIEELKKFQKQIKKNYQLSKDLYDTGIYDVMYLASLVADEAKMTPEDYEDWLGKATSDPLAEYAVAWVAAEGPHGWDLGLKWIESSNERTVLCGWQALSGWVSVKPNELLDVEGLRQLLQRVVDTIHDSPNRVRAVMNSFVISVGAYVEPLADEAMEAADAIGKVTVKLVGACKLPFAPDYIKKAQARGSLTKKRKMVRC